MYVRYSSEKSRLRGQCTIDQPHFQAWPPSCTVYSRLKFKKWRSQRSEDEIAEFVTNAPINVMPAGGGGGRAWGGDLIVFVVPGVGHLTDLVLPGEGIFESFFARRGDI